MPSENHPLQLGNATERIPSHHAAFVCRESQQRWHIESMWSFPELNAKREFMSCGGPFHSNDGYLQLLVLCRKLLTKAISANTNYDPQKF